MGSARPARPPTRADRLRRRMGRTLAWAQRQRLVRAAMRYHFGHGNLHAGGVTYSALLSLTAIVTILVNVARAFLGNRPQVTGALLAALDDAIPGLVKVGDSGLLDPELLVTDSPWHPATIVSGVVVVWTALSVMTGLRRSIRGMFGLAGAPLPILTGKARDVAGFLGLGVGIVLTSGLTGLVGTLGEGVLHALGVTGTVTTALVKAGSLVGAGLVDVGVFVMLFHVTAGVHAPRRDLLLGALLGAIGSGILRVTGTSIVGAIDDPLFAGFTALVTLLLWINLAVRLTLFAAAWTSNPPAPPLPVDPESVRAERRPNYVTESAPHTKGWPHHSVTGSLLPTDPASPNP